MEIDNIQLDYNYKPMNILHAILIFIDGLGTLDRIQIIYEK